MSRPSGRPIIKLRSAEQSSERNGSQRSARIIAISSGKGGVGKSSITLNLAVELARLQQRVCIFDADTNLANINIMTGLSPQYTLQDVLSGTQSLQNILLDGPQGVRIVPAASGVMDLVELDPARLQRLIDSLRELELQFDFILVDTAAGISESVLGFLQASSEVIIIITTEPTSLTDAFSLLKVLRQHGFDRSFQVVVNRVESVARAREVLMRFSGAVKKYIGLKIIRPGYVLEDHNVSCSVEQQIPYTLLYPDAPASHCVQHFAQRVKQGVAVAEQSLSAYLEEQLAWLESQRSPVEETSPLPDIARLLGMVHSAPVDQVEPFIEKINRAWNERVGWESCEATSFDETAGYRAAVRFAGLVNQR